MGAMSTFYTNVPDSPTRAVYRKSIDELYEMLNTMEGP
jgi:hypothetical protein